LMKDRRKALQRSAQRRLSASVLPPTENDSESDTAPAKGETEMADEEELAVVFDTAGRKQGYKDSEFYMSHYQKDAMTEKGVLAQRRRFVLRRASPGGYFRSYRRRRCCRSQTSSIELGQEEEKVHQRRWSGG